MFGASSACIINWPGPSFFRPCEPTPRALFEEMEFLYSLLELLFSFLMEVAFEWCLGGATKDWDR
jgi:hypothetical protein